MHQNSTVPVQFEGKKVIFEILIKGVLTVVIYAFSLTVFTLWSSGKDKEALIKYFAHWLQFDLYIHRKMDYELP